jgi:hypothetical protein
MTTIYQPGELDRRIEARGAEDGFLAAERSDDGGVWGCLGHVDRQRFLDQVRWQHLVLCGDTSYVDGVTVDRVAHSYMLRWTDQYGHERYSRGLPIEGDPVRNRPVTAEDAGAEPVTMLDV